MPVTYKMEMSIWQKPDGIHIRLDDDSGADIIRMATIRERPELERGHPYLYKQLKKILIADGKWE